MDSTQFRFLRPDVQLDPLVNRWYAWPHLIAPATAAMNIANHLAILRSYIAAPRVHAAAVRNPAMRGGPFLELSGERIAEVKDFAERTERDLGGLLRLAQALRDLSRLLRESNGQPLADLYTRVPEPLRGRVELIYDLEHRATARFIEALLYRSPYYDPSLQSISLVPIASDDRPFALSTPVLPDETRLDLRIPFASAAIDELFRARIRPVSLAALADTLGLGGREAAKLASFMIEEAPRPPPRPPAGGAVRIRYFGHACVLIESQDIAILVDPVIAYRFAGQSPRYTHDDLPPHIDYVLISHGHSDHLMFESLLQLRHRIGTVIVPRSDGGSLQDPSLRRILVETGFPDVREIDEFDAIAIPGGEIVGLPFLGEHGDLGIRAKTGYAIRLGRRRICLVADSDNLAPELYDHIASLIGEADVVYIGMECDGAPMSWLYGPLFSIPIDRKLDRARRLSGSDAARALALATSLRGRRVFVYAMGQEPWLGYITSVQYTPESRPIIESDRLVAALRDRGVPAERLLGCSELVLDM